MNFFFAILLCFIAHVACVCEGWHSDLLPNCSLDGVNRLIRALQDENCLPARQSQKNAEMVGKKLRRLVTEDPFVFFRGTAALFYYDMQCDDPTYVNRNSNLAPRVISTGDTHPENFGVLEMANKKLIWGPNDFDQAFSAPFTWDLKRGATGFVLACLARGWKKCDMMAQAWYRGYVSVFDGQCEYINNERFIENSTYVNRPDATPVRKTFENIRKKRASYEKTMKWLSKYVDLKTMQFMETTKIKPIRYDGYLEEFQAVVNNYLYSGVSALVRFPTTGEFWTVKDVAQKLMSGTGSIGLDRYYILLKGTHDKRPRILQMKQVVDSVLEKYIGFKYTAEEEASRVVSSQKAAYPFAGIFWGSAQFRERSFVLFELNKFKVSVDVSQMNEIVYYDYSRLAGRSQGFFHAKVSCASEKCDLHSQCRLDHELCHGISHIFKTNIIMEKDVVSFAVTEAKRIVKYFILFKDIISKISDVKKTHDVLDFKINENEN